LGDVRQEGKTSVSESPAPQTLRERLAWDPAQGRVCDGPRRYLLMRPDVLMGAVVGMVPAYRQSFLVGWAQSTRDHGADSLRAYAQMVQGDRDALMQATVEAAADLGWGRWSLTLEDGALHLQVQDSPFVAGWAAASPGQSSDEPVCAPIRGMLQALAEVVLQGPVDVEETHCRAVQTQSPSALEGSATTGFEAVQTHVPACRFLARARRPA
jgi:hypothetical protein